MARILYVEHYAGSIHHGMEFRPYYMAQHWVKAGHKVVIVAASYSHVRHSNPEVRDAWTEERVDGIDYVWLRTPSYEGNGFGRLRNIQAFVTALYRRQAALLEAARPDVVIASSTYPFDIFPAYQLARKAHARLIFELHDLWPLSPIELGGMSRWHPFIVAAQFAEDYVCRRADKIVSILPKADLHLRTRGMDPTKFVHIPNGIVLEEWSPENLTALPDEHANLLRRQRELGCFIMLYAGGHGLPNNLAPSLEAARMLEGERVCFVYVGKGPEKGAISRHAAALGLQNVHFLPPVSKPAIPALLGEADALFLSFAPQPLYRFGVNPNKLMDYMMAGKPIVAAMQAGNDPVTEHACGLTVPPNDPTALAEAVRHFMRLSPQARARLGNRGRAAVEKEYSYDVLARRFASLF